MQNHFRMIIKNSKEIVPGVNLNVAITDSNGTMSFVAAHQNLKKELGVSLLDSTPVISPKGTTITQIAQEDNFHVILVASKKNFSRFQRITLAVKITSLIVLKIDTPNMES